MSKHLKLPLVLLAALLIALMWSVPASGDEATATPTDVVGALDDLVEDTDVEGSVAPSSPPSDPAADDDTTDTGDSGDTSGSPAPSSSQPAPSQGAGQPGPSSQARVQSPGSPAAALALPGTTAILPPDFSEQDLADLLEDIGLPELSEENLAALLEALQNQNEEEDPLEDFCGLFDVPVLCGELPVGEEPPPFSCEEFALLFGLESCDDIPLCIPLPSPPSSLPIPLPSPPSPPFCESPASPTTPNNPNPGNPGTDKPPVQGSGGQPFTYRNCDEARAYGAAPVYSGQSGYGSHLDSDYDGVGCEETTAPVTQPVAYSGDGGKLAYTGVATEPLVAWGAALLASGAWLILSGRRRA